VFFHQNSYLNFISIRKACAEFPQHTSQPIRIPENSMNVTVSPQNKFQSGSCFEVKLTLYEQGFAAQAESAFLTRPLQTLVFCCISAGMKASATS
jgi:hypothetical protein